MGVRAGRLRKSERGAAGALYVSDSAGAPTRPSPFEGEGSRNA